MAKKQSELEQEYFKQRNRIKRFVRSAENRGYKFDKNPVPDVPKRITQQSVNRLSKLTPQSLYAKSTVNVTRYDKSGQAYTENISGEEYQQEVRREAGRRGYQEHLIAVSEGYESVADRRREYEAYEDAVRNAQPVNPITPIDKTLQTAQPEEETQENDYQQPQENANELTGLSQSDIEFEKKRRTLDAEERDNRVPHDEGDMILNNVRTLSEQYSSLGAIYLKDLLSYQTGKYGEEVVAETLKELEEQDSNLVSEITNMIFYQESGKGGANLAHRALRSLSAAITNKAHGEDYAKELGNVLDSLSSFSSTR